MTGYATRIFFDTKRPTDRPSDMPTVLEWNFEGGDDGSELAARRGKQRVFVGDTVVDEVLGQGKALRLAGAIMTIEFSEGSEKVERDRPHRPAAKIAYEYEKNRA